MECNGTSLMEYISGLQVNLIYASHRQLPPNWKYANYIPECNKIYYIRSGEGMIKIGNKELPLLPGWLYFLPAGTLQSASCTNSQTITKYWCHFYSNIVFRNLFFSFKIPYSIKIELDNEIDECFERLVFDTKMDAARLLNRKINLLRIISYFIDHVTIEKDDYVLTHPLDNLNEVVNYINRNLSSDMNIDQLSKIAHLHPTYFCRLFKSYLGEPPMHYVYKKRLEKAQNLLCYSSKSIKEIADLTGFNDINHLSKSFNKNFGISPGRYRREAILMNLKS